MGSHLRLPRRRSNSRDLLAAPERGAFFDKLSFSPLIGQHLGISTTFSDMSVKQYGRWVRCRFEGRRAQGNHTCRWKTSPDGCSVSPKGDLRARGRVISIGKRSALARFRTPEVPTALREDPRERDDHGPEIAPGAKRSQPSPLTPSAEGKISAHQC